MSLFKEMNPALKRTLGMAMGYLSIRSRSIQEIKNYLSKKEFTPVIVEQAVLWLRQENYLDDKLFARNHLENRKKNKPKSIYALGYELAQKGIAAAIIDQLLVEYDDLELALLAVLPKIKSWQHLEMEVFKKKMFNFLRYRGFGFSVIQATWERIFSSISDPDPSQ